MQAHTFDGWEYEQFERNGQRYIRRRKQNGSSYQVEYEKLEHGDPGELIHTFDGWEYAERLLTLAEQTLLDQLSGVKPAEPQLKLITVTEHYDNVIKEWYASDDMRKLLWTLYPDPPRPPAKSERPLSPARKLAVGFFLWLVGWAAVTGLLLGAGWLLVALLALLL